MTQRLMVCVMLLGGVLPTLQAQEKKSVQTNSIYHLQVKTIDGQKIDLAKYKGKVLLIVNVASECGYTDQYKALQALHAKYSREGLAILAFPCNDFGSQEPGDENKIKEFARKNYQVKFDLFSKIRILGKDSEPLYQFLTSIHSNPQNAGDVKWNFEKFIIGRDGAIMARFLSGTEPDSEDLLAALAKALRQK